MTLLDSNKAKVEKPTPPIEKLTQVSILDLEDPQLTSSLPTSLLSPVFEGVVKNGSGSSHPPVFFEDDGDDVDGCDATGAVVSRKGTEESDVTDANKDSQGNEDQKDPSSTPKKYKRKRSRPSTEAKREKRENKRTVYLFPLRPDSVSEDFIRGLMAEFGGLQLVEFSPDKTSCYARFENTPMATKARECGEKGGVKILFKLEHLEAIGQGPKNNSKGKNPKSRSRRSSSTASQGGGQGQGGGGGGGGGKNRKSRTSDADLDTNWRDKDQKKPKTRGQRSRSHVEAVAKNSPKPSPTSSPKQPSSRKGSDRRWRARSSSGATQSLNGSPEEKGKGSDDPRFSGHVRKYSWKTRRRSESDTKTGMNIAARVAKGPDGTRGFKWDRNKNLTSEAENPKKSDTPTS